MSEAEEGDKTGKDEKSALSPAPSPLRRRTTKLAEKKIAEDEFMAAAIGDQEWLRQSLRGTRGNINYDKSGLAPIHLAAIHGRLECLKLLVEKFKVDFNLPSKTGWRPIHLVISNQTGKRAFQCMLYLLEKGADPSVANEDGITPMHQAASEGHVQCLKALMEAGATIDGLDRRGHKPIDLAKLWGHRKCARILAAEQWQHDKQFLAHEMKQLQKLKMQEVLDEIQADEELAAEHQFYGEEAFQEWLRNRGLPPKPTSPSSASKKHEHRSTLVGSRKGQRKSREKMQNGELIPDKETLQDLYQPNSLQRSSPPQPRTPGTEPPASRGLQERKVQEASKSNAFGSMGREATAFSQSTDSGNMGLYERPVSLSPKQLLEVPRARTMLCHPGPWNKSTRVPQTFAPYMAMLPDHYPRDEYTMLPKHSAKRRSRSSTLLLAERSSAQSRKGPHWEKTKSKTMAPLKERPVVYKCKHVGDLLTKRHADPEKVPQCEIGMHMTNDVASNFFQSGLSTRRRLRSSGMSVSDMSRWSDSPELYGTPDLQRMLQMMKSMHGPTHFHGIDAEDYDLDLGGIAGV